MTCCDPEIRIIRAGIIDLLLAWIEMATTVMNGNECFRNGNDCSKWQRPFTKGKIAPASREPELRSPGCASALWTARPRFPSFPRRVATCKPGKPGLTSFSETLAPFFIQFLSFRKMKVQDRQNGQSKSFQAYQKKLAGYASAFLLLTLLFDSVHNVTSFSFSLWLILRQRVKERDVRYLEEKTQLHEQRFLNGLFQYAWKIIQVLIKSKKTFFCCFEFILKIYLWWHSSPISISTKIHLPYRTCIYSIKRRPRLCTALGEEKLVNAALE